MGIDTIGSTPENPHIQASMRKTKRIAAFAKHPFQCITSFSYFIRVSAISPVAYIREIKLLAFRAHTKPPLPPPPFSE